VHQKPGAQSVPGLLTLDELGCKAVPMKGCGRRETRYPTADDRIVSTFAIFHSARGEPD
jgi:hypothetical protein